MSDQANKNVLLEMKSSETLTASTCPNMKDPTVTATALGPRDSDTGDTYSTRHDVFIQEIEGMDDYWGSTFRAVYDQSDQVAFQRQLELRIRQHDRNIERMCNFHYQGFIDSIRQLLQVRADAGRLKTQVITGNEALQQQSQQLLAMAEQLERARRVRAHVAEGLAALRRCLPVLQAYSKLRKQMREQRFYPALRTLEQLEQLHLPRVAPYRFSQQMLESVPRMRQHIRAASMSDLKDFLEVVRRESARVGEAAMRRLVEPAAGGRPTPVVEKRLTLAFLGVDALQAISVYGQGEHVEEDADVSPQDLVDFSTVYRCLHVFSALGDGESFRSYYLMQRQKQAALALRPPASSGSGQPPALVGVRDCLHGVAGFFVIEDHVFNTARGLVTRSQLDNLWAETFSELTEVLQTNAVTCTDANLLLTLARLISLFGRTMRDYGYPVSALHQLLLGLRQHYTEVLMQRWVTVFREIFLLDNYHPVQVDTAAEYAQIAAVFPYQNAQLERAPFPRQFPFSLMVPKVYSQVKEFIHSCLRFSEELELSQSEKDDALRRSTNVLLTRTLSGCLATLIRQPGLGLLQLIQITINTLYLEQASGYLEDVITKITGYNPKMDGGIQSRLQGGVMFKDIRAETEQQIYRQLQAKIDEFLELAAYDWLLPEAEGTASAYLVDLVYFLSTTFTAFTNLPAKVAQTALMSACQHVARELMDLLLGEEVRQMSLGALQQLNLDVIQCEQFAASEPVAGFEDEALQMCFADLRQLLDLVLDWDWTTYFQQYGSENSKYARVSPQRAVVVVEKLRDADKRNMFSVLKRADRDRKKLQDTVLKQLRQLTQAG